MGPISAFDKNLLSMSTVFLPVVKVAVAGRPSSLFSFLIDDIISNFLLS